MNASSISASRMTTIENLRYDLVLRLDGNESEKNVHRNMRGHKPLIFVDRQERKEASGSGKQSLTERGEVAKT
jgi:hypothetical protein